MDIHESISEQTSRLVTERYSSSFSSAIKLFPREMRPHIYNIYGLVRIADEIVDTYRGADSMQRLDELELETYRSLETGYSTNYVVQAYVMTANEYGLRSGLLPSFFDSMRMDLEKKSYTPDEYKRYIYGSAEVVGLMCLQVFCEGDEARFDELQPGAQALGSAFQKLNFLRDISDDSNELQRSYFPYVDPCAFTENDKEQIIADIRRDLAIALPSLRALPPAARPALMTAYLYNNALLNKLERADASELTEKRIRLSRIHKLSLLGKAVTMKYFGDLLG